MYFCKDTTTKFLDSNTSKVTVWKVVNSDKKDAVTGKFLSGGWNSGKLPVFLNRNYARKFKNENEKVIRCKVLSRDVIGVTRTKDEAIVKKVFIPKKSLIGKSE